LDPLGKPGDRISYVTDRLDHDRRYAIDSTRLQETLGWSTKHDFETSIRETVDWYVNNVECAEKVTASTTG
jgi:dTDP-glucose 4,6-dehydratase